MKKLRRNGSVHEVECRLAIFLLGQFKLMVVIQKYGSLIRALLAQLLQIVCHRIPVRTLLFGQIRNDHIPAADTEQVIDLGFAVRKQLRVGPVRADGNKPGFI
ncbi:hypothetical protein D3C73_1359500 [compost metagenome]